VTPTLTGLAEACGLPKTCSCSVHHDTQGDSFHSPVCESTCAPNPVDGTCTNFDPKAFTECLASGMTVDQCKDFVSATNASGAGDPICVASGSPLAFHAFGHRSQCDVAGTSEIKVGDKEPTHDPATNGTIEILGGPCTGGGCSVTPSITLAMAPITFSVKFHSDPTFDHLRASGRGLESALLDTGGQATFPQDSIDGTGSASRGSDSGQISSKNATPVVLGIDWDAKTCSLEGNLAGDVDAEVPTGHCDGDDSVACTADSPDCDDAGGPCVFDTPDTEAMTVDVTLDTGTLVNQPPTAVAGLEQTVECSSPTGASFELDGRGSSDPDQNLVLASWRSGSRVGPLVSSGLEASTSLGLGEQTYVLRVIDAFAQTDEDSTKVKVVDTTPPSLSLSVAPTVLGPPNHKLIPITATLSASDVCDPSPQIRLLSITSNEPDNGLGDGDTPGDVQDAAFGTDDRSFQLRAERSGRGTGRIYTITYEARDQSGNATIQTATVSVPKK
jgi:hypothetical protein